MLVNSIAKSVYDIVFSDARICIPLLRLDLGVAEFRLSVNCERLETYQYRR